MGYDMVNAQMEGWSSFCWVVEEDTISWSLAEQNIWISSDSGTRMLQWIINLLKWRRFIKQHTFRKGLFSFIVHVSERKYKCFTFPWLHDRYRPNWKLSKPAVLILMKWPYQWMRFNKHECYHGQPCVSRQCTLIFWIIFTQNRQEE